MHIVVPIATGLAFLGSALIAVPNLALEWMKRSSPEVVFSVVTDEKLVALTVDDGPSAATPEILAVLEEHDAHATFFLIGEHVEELPDVARRIVEEGHELGHHMMADRPSRELSPDEFEARFDEMDGLLEGLGGSEVFRPGSGWFDDRMVRVAESRGYRTILGSVYPFDAHIPWPGFHSWYVRQTIRPGAIVVLHDGGERGVRTVEVLRTILPELTAQGYEIVTVSQLVGRAKAR